MHEKTPDKFQKGKGDRAPWVTSFFAAGRKSDPGVCHGKDPAVGYGDLMGVASKILDGVAKAVKGLFDIRAPVFLIETVLEGLPVGGIFQRGTGGGKSKGAFFVKLVQQCQVFPFEFIPEDKDRDKKVTGR